MNSKNIALWDLDSTLIDTNLVFEEAQRNVIKRLSDELKNLNVEINPDEEQEMDLLRAVDYEGIKIRGHTRYDSAHQLPLSLLFIYLGKSGADNKYKAAWLANKGYPITEEIGKEYIECLGKTPKKFPGIEDILEESAKKNYNILFTEYFENRENQYKKITENGLEKYFDKVIMTEKKDELAIASAVEYSRLENKIEKGKNFKLIYIDDRSKYLEMMKRIYPFCTTINVLFNKKEIFRETSGKVDYIAKDIGELTDLIKNI